MKAVIITAGRSAIIHCRIILDVSRSKDVACGYRTDRGRLSGGMTLINQDDAMMWFYEIAREAGKDDKR